MGVGYSYRVRLQRRILCPECGVDLTAEYMTAHRRHMHRTEPAIDWSRLPVRQIVHQPQVYDVIFPWEEKQCPCPFPRCLGSSHTWNGLRLHFKRNNWGDRIRILEEQRNPLPRWELCRIQVQEGRPKKKTPLRVREM